MKAVVTADAVIRLICPLDNKIIEENESVGSYTTES